MCHVLCWRAAVRCLSASSIFLRNASNFLFSDAVTVTFWTSSSSPSGLGEASFLLLLLCLLVGCLRRGLGACFVETLLGEPAERRERGDGIEKNEGEGRSQGIEVKGHRG